MTPEQEALSLCCAKIARLKAINADLCAALERRCHYEKKKEDGK